METDKRLLGLLGIARRAGKLDLGTQAAKQAAHSRKARLILLTKDLSPRTAASVRAEAESSGVPVRELCITMDEAEAALGKRTGVIAVNDKGFAGALLAPGAEQRGGIIL